MFTTDTIKKAHVVTGINAKALMHASRSIDYAVKDMFESDKDICARYEKFNETYESDTDAGKKINETVAKEKLQKSTSKSNKFNLPDLFKGGNDSPEINPLEYISK